jgi:hypothetical protein
MLLVGLLGVVLISSVAAFASHTTDLFTEETWLSFGIENQGFIDLRIFGTGTAGIFTNVNDCGCPPNNLLTDNILATSLYSLDLRQQLTLGSDSVTLERQLDIELGIMNNSTLTSSISLSSSFSGTGNIDEAIYIGGVDPCSGSVWLYLNGRFSLNERDSNPSPRKSMKVLEWKIENMELVVTLKNTGNQVIKGPATVTAGLSYWADWVPEGRFYNDPDIKDDWNKGTWFWQDSNSLGRITLKPGETTTIRFSLPPIPDDAVKVFQARWNYWWFGNTDQDPDHDFVGFIIDVGGMFGNGVYAVAYIPFLTNVNI